MSSRRNVSGDCATITIGETTVTVYESSIRPGGVTVDIDAPGGTDLLVIVNDGDVFRDEVA